MNNENSTPQGDTPPSQAESCFFPTFLARQPIFDAKQRVWGHELLFRDSRDATRAEFQDMDKATMDVAASLFASPALLFDQDKKTCINFGHKSLLEQVPYALPYGQTVIEVAETDLGPGDLGHVIRDLKHAGYLIAVDDYENRAASRDQIGLADLIIIDVLGRDRDSSEALIQAAHAHDVLLLAKKLESQQDFQLAHELGFHLFQGFFFREPELVTGRKLTSHEISRFRLFKEIEKEDPDIDHLVETIQADVSISYRLLAYLNTPFFGFSQKIASIKQAVMLLGWKQLRNWLRVVILTDLTPRARTTALYSLALQRAKFFEIIASVHAHRAVNADNLFLLGLFSLLEPMLNIRMEEIVGHLPLQEELKKALCQEKTSYTPWLDLVRALETGSWEDMDPLVAQLQLNAWAIANAYGEATIWAKSFFSKDA